MIEPGQREAVAKQLAKAERELRRLRGQHLDPVLAQYVRSLLRVIEVLKKVIKP